MLTIRLNDDFNVVLDEKYSLKPKTIPKSMKGDKVLYAIEEEHVLDYRFHSIQTKSGKLVSHEVLIHEFIELLQSFVGNHLDPKKSYFFADQKGGAFKANITAQNKIISLKIIVADESYFLDKYQCRVIGSKLIKIYSKCEFNFYQ